MNRPNRNIRHIIITISAISITVLIACSPGKELTTEENRQQTASTAPSQTTLPEGNPLKNAYFGDLHLHTQLSLDAFLNGMEVLPDDAYRYARGESVTYMGKQVQRRTPLNFLAVTDHAEFLGILNLASQADGPLAETELHRILTRGDQGLIARLFWKLNNERPSELLTDELIHDQWQVVIDAAQTHYRPGEFTTFAAFEWSSTPQLQNLHRNILFPGPNFPERPFSYFDSERPEDLWAYLDRQRALGIDSRAIPHNSNLSNGLMFSYLDFDGNPISRAYAEERMRNETTIEITQAKGTSETTPGLSPNDEFADFELYTTLLGGGGESRSDGSYIRQGLARGLEIGDKIGINPFKYGLVGASDFHSGVSASEENNYPGGHGRGDSATTPAATLSGDALSLGARPKQFSASGLTGVWAERNTREAIFAALNRKEVFATSGGRIRVRLFGGWNYPAGLTERENWIALAYREGVPMGADLPSRPGTVRTPTFLLQAVKDPDAGNLDRLQIVKVWYADGAGNERVFDVAWSGDRKPDPQTGKLPAVGNTVNLDTATYDNSIGVPQLTTQWRDPEFDPNVPAVYYARILEIPTPRWSTYLAVRNKLPLPEGVPATIQERAWTSPIFYTPGQ